MKPTRTTLAAAALLALSLGACSRSEPEAPPIENTAIDDAGVTDTSPAEEPAPAPSETETPVEANATADLPPEEAAAPDEQMLDDASATGMTARANRGEMQGGDPATAPAAESTTER